MVARIEPAAINLQLELNIPCRLFTPTGSVYIDSLVNTMLGHKNSPHEPIKVNIARTASEGLTIGSRTFVNTCQTLQPSTIAASSISLGIPKKACRIKNIPNALTANGIINPINPAKLFTLSTRCNFNVIK